IGGLPNAFATDAIITFVSDVYAAWNSGKVTSSLDFNNKGCFDNVNHARLLHGLRSEGLPLPYVRWV
ncbi:hypothetical protein K525DRAFT_147288, partial [Schizophyllum commune Loenen D]